jgi:hypothetical protein
MSFHQELVNLLMFPMWEHCTLDNYNFECSKVYYSNSIIITNVVQTLVPNCWFENAFSSLFGIEFS